MTNKSNVDNVSVVEEVVEEETLFPEAKVGDITIKPWSFGKLFELSKLLTDVLDKADSKGVTKLLDSSNDFISYTTMARLFSIASPEVLKIMQMTLDKTEEEVRDFSMEDGVKIAFIIFKQNRETIKNALTLT